MADTRVTDRFLAENMQELYERAPCGYVLTYPDGVFARVNETFLTWTGLSRDDLIGTRKFQDLLTLPGKIFYENQYFPLLRMQGSHGGDRLRLVAQQRGTLAGSRQLPTTTWTGWRTTRHRQRRFRRNPASRVRT
jgi:PAS domain-containing protein